MAEIAIKNVAPCAGCAALIRRALLRRRQRVQSRDERPATLRARVKYLPTETASTSFLKPSGRPATRCPPFPAAAALAQADGRSAGVSMGCRNPRARSSPASDESRDRLRPQPRHFLGSMGGVLLPSFPLFSARPSFSGSWRLRSSSGSGRRSIEARGRLSATTGRTRPPGGRRDVGGLLFSAVGTTAPRFCPPAAAASTFISIRRPSSSPRSVRPLSPEARAKGRASEAMKKLLGGSLQNRPRPPRRHRFRYPANPPSSRRPGRRPAGADRWTGW